MADTSPASRRLYQGSGPTLDPDDPVIPHRRLIVVSLGEGILDVCHGGAPFEGRWQRADHVAAAVQPMMDRHQLVITYSAAPRLGLLGLWPDTGHLVGSTPFPVLSSATSGVDALLLETAFRSAAPRGEFAAVMGSVAVDPNDPEFTSPSRHDWLSGRLIPTPFPREYLATNAVRHLLEAGVGVVCAGGGGSTVVIDEMGKYRAVEAVTDHECTSAMIAAALSASLVIFVVSEHEQMATACRTKLAIEMFVQATGHAAVTGTLDELSLMLSSVDEANGWTSPDS